VPGSARRSLRKTEAAATRSPGVTSKLHVQRLLLLYGAYDGSVGRIGALYFAIIAWVAVLLLVWAKLGQSTAAAPVAIAPAIFAPRAGRGLAIARNERIRRLAL
jgi:hypothetical protein